MKDSSKSIGDGEVSIFCCFVVFVGNSNLNGLKFETAAISTFIV